MGPTKQMWVPNPIDEKYFIITASDHNTSEQYYFSVKEEMPQPKLIKERKKGIIYSVNSWNNYFLLSYL